MKMGSTSANWIVSCMCSSPHILWLPSAMVARLASIAKRHQKVAGSSPAVVMSMFWFFYASFCWAGLVSCLTQNDIVLNTWEKNNIFKS
jgi:hypothetical protein